MGKIQKVQGFVLKKKNLLNADAVITVFSKELGKLTIIGKGIRKITSKRQAHFQTGNLIKTQLSGSHGMPYIQSSELISGFASLRIEQNINYIYLMLSIIDALLPEGMSEINVYTIILNFYIDLGKNNNPLVVFTNSLQKILEILGYVNRQMAYAELIDIVESNIEKRLPRHVIM